MGVVCGLGSDGWEPNIMEPKSQDREDQGCGEGIALETDGTLFALHLPGHSQTRSIHDDTTTDVNGIACNLAGIVRSQEDGGIGNIVCALQAL